MTQVSYIKGNQPNRTFSAIGIPQILIKYLLHASHNSLGHIGATKLYHFLKRLYYFQGRRRIIHQHVRSCPKCQIMNLQNHTFLNYIKILHKPQKTMVSINILGPYNINSQNKSYTLTAVCNLTGYLMTTPVKDKSTMTVANHLFLDIMLKLCFCTMLHLDNGMEFKSKLIEYLSQQLGIKKTYISPCNPHANRKLESSHRFIKGLYS